MVTGTAKKAAITISIIDGGTEQRMVTIPYTSPTYTFKGMESAYISAQNMGGRSSVTATISVNNWTLKKATSEGGYTIAKVNWFVGSTD
jgi:hypothetical protein